jgi:uncharacterized membrane-anchored protein
MNKNLLLAVSAQVFLMLVGLVAPLAVKTTGATIYLETQPVDPRAFLRGDYVVLGYAVGQEAAKPEIAGAARRTGKPVYVTVTTDRPARFVAAGLERPKLDSGQACLQGHARKRGSRLAVDFPQIAQFFVPEGEGREIERQLRQGLLAEVKVNRRCDAVLVGLEER